MTAQSPSAPSPNDAHRHDLSPIEIAVLTRSWILHDVGATASKLRDSIPLLEPGLGNSALTERAVEAAESLAQRGLLELVGKGNRRKAHSTKTGRLALTELGIWDKSPPPSWTELRDVDLTALALGLTPPATPEQRQRFKSASGLRGAVLATFHELELPAFPLAGDAVNALAWRELSTALKIDASPWQQMLFGAGAGLACVIGHRFGLRRKVPAGKLAALSAAACMQASGSDTRALRAAIWRRWAREHEASGQTSPRTTTDRSLPGWIEEHRQTLQPYTQGSNKVFIAELWRVLRAKEPGWFPTIEALKSELLDLARSRQLELARADLVEGMDPDLVRSSEIRDLHSSFHFLRLG